MTNNWICKESINPEEYYGFVYKITNLTNNKFYIGKKQFKSVTNVKLGKKELNNLPIQRGRKPTKKQVIKDSNWVNYWSSSKDLINDVKTLGEDKFKREILILCKTKKELTYYETYYQFTTECLLTDLSYNDNILGHFFRKDLVY